MTKGGRVVIEEEWEGGQDSHLLVGDELKAARGVTERETVREDTVECACHVRPCRLSSGPTNGGDASSALSAWLARGVHGSSPFSQLGGVACGKRLAGGAVVLDWVRGPRGEARDMVDDGACSNGGKGGTLTGQSWVSYASSSSSISPLQM